MSPDDCDMALRYSSIVQLRRHPRTENMSIIKINSPSSWSCFES